MLVQLLGTLLRQHGAFWEVVDKPNMIGLRFGPPVVYRTLATEASERWAKERMQRWSMTFEQEAAKSSHEALTHVETVLIWIVQNLHQFDDVRMVQFLQNGNLPVDLVQRASSKSRSSGKLTTRWQTAKFGGWGLPWESTWMNFSSAWTNYTFCFLQNSSTETSDENFCLYNVDAKELIVLDTRWDRLGQPAHFSELTHKWTEITYGKTPPSFSASSWKESSLPGKHKVSNERWADISSWYRKRDTVRPEQNWYCKRILNGWVTN